MKKSRVLMLSVVALASQALMVVGVHASGDSPCVVSFDLVDDAQIGGLQFEMDYSELGGTFVKVDRMAGCVAAGPFSVIAYDSCDGSYEACHVGPTRILKAAVMAPMGIRGPAALAKCAFLSDQSVDELAVVTRVIDAHAPDLAPLNALPNITASIACDATAEASAASLDVPPAFAREPTAPDELLYEVSFSVESPMAWGALDLTVHYPGRGKFSRRQRVVECSVTPGVPVAAAFNDCNSLDQRGCVETQVLKAAFAGGMPVNANGALFSCIFVSADGVPKTDEFNVEVTNASNPETVDTMPPRVTASLVAGVVEQDR